MIIARFFFLKINYKEFFEAEFEPWIVYQISTLLIVRPL